MQEEAPKQSCGPTSEEVRALLRKNEDRARLRDLLLGGVASRAGSNR
jgi:hypothetical protein